MLPRVHVVPRPLHYNEHELTFNAPLTPAQSYQRRGSAAGDDAARGTHSNSCEYGSRASQGCTRAPGCSNHLLERRRVRRQRNAEPTTSSMARRSGAALVAQARGAQPNDSSEISVPALVHLAPAEARGATRSGSTMMPGPSTRAGWRSCSRCIQPRVAMRPRHAAHSRRTEPIKSSHVVCSLRANEAVEKASEHLGE